ncbi:hypothetical protein Btru_053495 [Bulinus truncatus]|nr:hypothetical protein Btru_053495 [Bulinus truncatus]
MFCDLADPVIIIVSVAIMIRCLKKASKFRQRHAGDPDTEIPILREPEHQQRKMTTKDVLIVRQVILISVVYIIANIPKILVDIGTFIVPDFTLGKRYQNVYLAIICAMEFFQGFNSSLNMIIYYKYNSKFRKHLSVFNDKPVLLNSF